MSGGINFSRLAEPFRGLPGTIGKKLMVFFGGVLSAWASVGNMYPFAVAYTAAAPRGFSALAAAGAITGCFLPYGAADTIRAVSSVVAAAGILWACSELKKVCSHPAFRPIAALTAVVLTGAVVSGATGAQLSYDILLYAAEGILSAAGTYFMASASDSLRAGRMYALERRETGAVVIFMCIIATGFCRICVWGFSPGRVLVLFAMLLAAKKGRETTGAVAGVAAGAVLAASGSNLSLSGMCAIAGLAAGVFANLGTTAEAVAAVSVGILASYASNTVNFFILSEMMTASVIFRLIPSGVTDKLLSRIGIVREDSVGVLPETQVAEKLENAANALKGVGETVEKVSRRLNRHTSGIEQIYRRATEKVCGACPLSGHCWGDAREETQKNLESLGEILQKDGRLTVRTTPMELKQNCARSSEMTEEINGLYSDMLARENAKRRIAQVRSVIGDQMGGVSTMLSDLAEKTREEDTPDTQAAQAVSEALRRSGYVVDSVRCIVSSTGRMSVKAKVNGRRGKAIARNELVYELEDALGVPLSSPKIEGGAQFTLTASQEPEFCVQFGAAQHCCSGERLCGDTYEAFIDTEGNAVMIISDGMGSGGRAAVDSAMTCGLTARLLKAGFGFDGAMKIVNSALLIKSDDESLATLDVTRVNLFTGEAQLCKAGAVNTYILSGREMRLVSAKSLPLGILREIKYQSDDAQLRDGDVIIMTSDGVPDGEGWLEEQIKNCDVTDMKTLARALLERAREGREEGDDDITVLAAKLTAA